MLTFDGVDARRFRRAMTRRADPPARARSVSARAVPRSLVVFALVCVLALARAPSRANAAVDLGTDLEVKKSDGTVLFTVDDATGDCTVGGTLSSAGVATLASANVTGTLASGATTLSSATVSGALSAGATTITGATGITGATTITGATVMKGDVTVKKSDGSATVLTVAGATGNTVISGTLNAGASTLASASVTGSLSSGAATLASATVSGALSAGATTIASATLNGDVTTFGDISISKTASAITHTAAAGATSGLTISSDNGFVEVESVRITGGASNPTSGSERRLSSRCPRRAWA